MQAVARCSLVFVIAVGLGCNKAKQEPLVEPAATSAAPTTESALLPEPPPPPPESETSSSDAPAPMRTLSELMALAIYTPDPDVRLLQQTKAARFDKADGSSTVQFCVEADGVTSDIRTIEPFPGDPLIDQIVRDTVAKWRFKALASADFPGKVCTQRTYNFRFKPAPPKDAG